MLYGGIFALLCDGVLGYYKSTFILTVNRPVILCYSLFDVELRSKSERQSKIVLFDVVICIVVWCGYVVW